MAYRLLPMVLPAAMPKGPTIWISAVLLETGVSGLFVTLLVRSPLVWVFALIVVAGFAAFGSHVVWMLRRPRPRPPGLRRPDPAVLHAAASFFWLVVASTLGVWLTLAAPSPNTLRVAMAYGVFGLVGFLAQMVVGMEGRLLPIFAWYWAYANTEYKGPVLSQHEMPWRYGQDLVFLLWLFGVPSLAGGLALDAVPFVSGGRVVSAGRHRRRCGQRGADLTSRVYRSAIVRRHVQRQMTHPDGEHSRARPQLRHRDRSRHLEPRAFRRAVPAGAR